MSGVPGMSDAAFKMSGSAKALTGRRGSCWRWRRWRFFPAARSRSAIRLPSARSRMTIGPIIRSSSRKRKRRSTCRSGPASEARPPRSAHRLKVSSPITTRRPRRCRPGIDLGAVPGQGAGPRMRLGQATMTFRYEDSFPACEGIEGYAHLILDAMLGDPSLFTTAAGVERLWEISTPLLDDPPLVEPYQPGSWGPPPPAGSSPLTAGTSTRSREMTWSRPVAGAAAPGDSGERGDGAGRPRRQPAGGGGQVGRRGADRVGVDVRRGGAFLGGHRQRGASW